MLSLICDLSGHTEERVWHVSFSHCGNFLVTCGEDKTLRIWGCSSEGWEKADTITCISTLEDGQSRTIRCCEWSPDGRMIASASFDGTIVIWESQNFSLTAWDMIASLEGHENEVKCISWSPNGKLLATCNAALSSLPLTLLV